MRVLQIISSAGLYGAETMLLNLADALRAVGCEMTVAVFRNRGHNHTEVGEEAAKRGLDVRIIDCGGKVDYRAVRMIRAIAEEKHTDLLHTHGYKADLYGYLAATRSKLPIVATQHQFIAEDKLTLRLYHQIDAWVLRRFRKVAAVSTATASLLVRSGIDPTRVETVDNGIDVDAFRAAEAGYLEHLRKSNGQIVGLVGRLISSKGGSDFLVAACNVLLEAPNTIFVFAGEGPERAALERQARDLGLAESVYFLGRCEDMPALYGALDVVVLPSYVEGLPMTLIEALAAKRPVVATPVGAVSKVIQHEETGLLVNPGDLDALKTAILRLLKDKELCTRMAARGYGLVREKFSAASMADKYLGLYQEALGTNERKSRAAGGV